jgi:hypothetical protein
MRVLVTRIYPVPRPDSVWASERVGPRIKCAGDAKFPRETALRLTVNGQRVYFALREA